MSQEPLSDNQTSQQVFQAIIPGASQKVTTSAVSAQSTTLGGQTTMVRLTCSADCYIAFGTSSAPNPTANTTTSMFMPAGIVDYHGVTPSTKIAAIQSSAGGILFITEAK